MPAAELNCLKTGQQPQKKIHFSVWGRGWMRGDHVCGAPIDVALETGPISKGPYLSHMLQLMEVKIEYS
jgi:hypothetical protein